MWTENSAVESGEIMMENNISKQTAYYMIVSLLLISTAIAVPIWISDDTSADTPSKIYLAYDYGKETLTVYIDHASSAPDTHYIETVTINVNDVEYLTKTYSSQKVDDGKGMVTYSYSVTASDGDVISVTAKCSDHGSLTDTLTVEADGGGKDDGETADDDNSTGDKNGSVDGTDGNGTIELPGLPVDGNYNYVTLADVNKDTYPDIIASGAGRGGYHRAAPGGLRVYLNQNGNSFINSSSGLPMPGDDNFHATHSQLQLIDINKDSNLDIVAAEWLSHQYEGVISIYLGNGEADGSMQWTPAEGPGLLGSWSGVQCGDIDGDGHIDLVAGGAYGLNVWKGNHAGGVLNWTDASSGIPESMHHVSSIKLADLNHDGRLDIVTGMEEGPGIQIYICSETGEISWIEGHSSTAISNIGIVWDVVLTNLDGDTHLDLIASGKNGIRAYLGNGNIGGRSVWWTDVSNGLPTSGTYYQLAVDDIDNDGKLDISSAMQIWSNSQGMSSSTSYSWEGIGTGLIEDVSVGMAMGDLDLDGKMDLVCCGWENNYAGIHAFTNLTLGSADPGSGGVPDSSIPGERVWFVKRHLMEEWTPRPGTEYILVAMIGWNGILVENTQNREKIGFENKQLINNMEDDTAETIMRNDWKTVFVIYDDGSDILDSLTFTVDSDPVLNPYGWPYILEITYYDGEKHIYVNTTNPMNNVVISRDTLHRFNIDLDIVATGDINGVWIDIDEDGDGEFESAMTPEQVIFNVQIEGSFASYVDDDDDDDDTGGKEEEGENNSISWIMFVLIAILGIVIGGVGVFLLVSKFVDRTAPNAEDNDVHSCPICKTDMIHMPDFNRWKCPQCGKYE
jgi:hypothetical protein